MIEILHRLGNVPGFILLEDGPDGYPDPDFTTQYPAYIFSAVILERYYVQT